MFWTHDLDSMNTFKELTQERRCKDQWLPFCIQKDFIAGHSNFGYIFEKVALLNVSSKALAKEENVSTQTPLVSSLSSVWSVYLSPLLLPSPPGVLRRARISHPFPPNILFSARGLLRPAGWATSYIARYLHKYTI